MRIKSINYAMWALLLMPVLSFAQVESLSASPETASAFAGAQFYSRTLENQGEQESVYQWVFPLHVVGRWLTEDLRFRLYQTLSSAQLEDNPGLTGLENTKIQTTFRMFANAVTYFGLSLPVADAELRGADRRLSNLLYTEALQFGVDRISTGLDLDIGFAWVQPVANLSLGVGAGYTFTGSYDRPAQGKDSEGYDPGDTFSFTATADLRRGIMVLNGNILHLRYGDDRIGDRQFRVGNDFSGSISATFQFQVVRLTLFLADTIKGDSTFPPEEAVNLFRNKLVGGVYATYTVRDELVLKARGIVKQFQNQGEVNSRLFAWDGGIQLKPFSTSSFTLEAFVGRLNGEMDTGKTQISGWNLGFLAERDF